MARAAQRPIPQEERFTEKEFYLEEFRGHSLLIAVRGGDLLRVPATEALARVIRPLIGNDTRLLLLVSAGEAAEATRLVRSLQRRLGPTLFREETLALFPALRSRQARANAFAVVEPEPEEPGLATLTKIWNVIRGAPVLVAAVPFPHPRLAGYAQHLAGRLRVHKLVLVEPEGGVCDGAGRQISFMDVAMLEALLAAGEAESTGVAHRRATLEAVKGALRAGVAAVNLCSLGGLERELFTYEGSGTLFTLEDYCRVAPLGIDDFEEVERLIERGQREGFLKTRSVEEIAQIVLCGYGATIGSHHLAGICALHTEPYRRERAGEVVSLYTITRFKGEFVGRKLLASVEAEARQRQLAYLFAVTTEVRAQSFFQRCGFAHVSPADVPAAKWAHYDSGRMQQVAVYRMDLVPAPARRLRP